MPIGYHRGYTSTPSTKKKATIKPFSSTGGDRPTVPGMMPTITPRTTAPFSNQASTVAANSLIGPPGSAVSGSSVGTPNQTSAVKGLDSSGSSQYTGIMKNFNPGATQDTIFQNPQAILNFMAQKSGMSTAGPMYNTLRDFYGADPQSLWFLTQGAQGGADGTNALNANTYGNFLNSMYSNYMSPNGRAFDFDEMLRNISGLSDQSNKQIGDQSPLWQLLSSGGAGEQANTMYGLLADAARVGLAPSMASAFMDALRRQSDSYLTQNMQSTGGSTVPFYDWMQNPMKGR